MTNNSYIHYTRLRLNNNSPSIINAVQYDNARRFIFMIEEDFIPDEDSEVRVYVRKPSGKEIYDSCILKNNDVIVQPSKQMLAETGVSFGQIQIISNSKFLTSFPFILNVEENLINSSNIESSDELSILDHLINDARRLIIEMEEAVIEEEKREKAEMERQDNEEKRKQSEILRNNNESTRIDQENTRSQSEQDRISSEEIRSSSEKARIEAEKKRQENTSIALNNCDTATDMAKTAAKAANDIANELQQKLENGDFIGSVENLPEQEVPFSEEQNINTYPSSPVVLKNFIGWCIKKFKSLPDVYIKKTDLITNQDIDNLSR